MRDMQQHATSAALEADTILAPNGMTMEEWMRDEGLNDQQVADLMENDKTTVWRVRTGRARPSHGFIEKAIEVSKGAIDANSFFKRALIKAAASRGGDASEAPFSSASRCPNGGGGRQSRSPRRPRPASSSPSSPAPDHSAPSSATRSSR